MRYSEYHSGIRKQARELVSVIAESSTQVSDTLVSIVEKVVKEEGYRFEELGQVVRESADKIVSMFGIGQNIKLLGSGTYGIALGTGDGNVLKITTDMDELDSTSLLIEKNLPNVMSVLKVAKKKDMDVAFIQYPVYNRDILVPTSFNIVYSGY